MEAPSDQIRLSALDLFEKSMSNYAVPVTDGGCLDAGNPV